MQCMASVQCTWTLLVHLTFPQLSQDKHFHYSYSWAQSKQDRRCGHLIHYHIWIYSTENIFQRAPPPQPGSSNLRPPASPTTLEHKLRKLLVGDELVIVATRPRDGDEVNLIIIGIMAVVIILDITTTLNLVHIRSKLPTRVEKRFRHPVFPWRWKDQFSLLKVIWIMVKQRFCSNWLRKFFWMLKKIFPQVATSLQDQTPLALTPLTGLKGGPATAHCSALCKCKWQRMR